MRFREFNFGNYKEWFNKEFNDAGYYLDEGMFPEDGEIGINPVGYEIAVLVYPEGIDTIDCIDLLSEKYPEFINDILSLKKEKRGKLKRECMLLPFEDKYIPIFETIAVEFCKDHIEVDKALRGRGEDSGYGPVKVEISLQDFLNGGTEDWRKFPNEKHKNLKDNFINLLKYDKCK